MSDLISRQAALDCFHDWVDKYGDVHTADEMVEYQRIEALPAVQRWIPCAERPPDENLWTGKRQCSESVLMTVYCAEDEERITDYGHTVDGRWYSETIQKYVPDCWEVVAWCPLPEPYKGEE